MHLEILVEDQSGEKLLNVLIPQLIKEGDTFVVHSYKGIGRIPKDLRGRSDPQARILLDRLPKILRGYAKTHADYPDTVPAAVVVVCDLDNRCLKQFRGELDAILASCHPRPTTRFCIAIEEGEAWLLGDLDAIRKAYPNARDAVLNSYVNDSICGTWEHLADALFRGGSAALKRNGWNEIGREKSQWAKNIGPKMDVENNQSPSFCYFREEIRKLCCKGE